MNKTTSFIIATAVITSIFIACKKEETKPEEATITAPTPTTGWIQKTSPVTSALNDVEFYTNKFGYAVGDFGKVIRTTNGGETWTQQTVTSSSDANINCSIIDSQTVFVINFYSIYKTTDGGTTWMDLTPTNLGFPFFNDLYFISNTTGFLATSTSIATTTDGGSTWNIIPSSAASFGWKKIQFTDANTGWATGQSGVIKTVDGGTNWTSVNPGLTNPQTSFFVNNTTGWAAKSFSGNDTIKKTIDGGVSWTIANTAAAQTSSLKAMYFFSADNGVQSRTLSKINKTTNGGTTWAGVTTPLTTQSITSFYFNSINLGWAVGEGGVILKYTE